MKIEYTKIGDYYFPNLYIPIKDKLNYVIGKYGRAKLNYIKKHKSYYYTDLLLNGDLQNHLIDVDKICSERLELTNSSLKEKSNITEEMKNTNPLYWVETMNAIKNQAEEIIYNELIYMPYT